MTCLLILNRPPYDATDVSWNALRLADKLLGNGHAVRIFLMNDAVDLARESCRPSPGYDQDLVAILKGLIASGAAVKVCGTCMARCGIHRNEPYYEGASQSTMSDLAEWVAGSDRVLTF
ncbi:MAG: DsrE/DsrF/TusD sulfur relay family protein [Terrimicrobiaceae bacterium]